MGHLDAAITSIITKVTVYGPLTYHMVFGPSVMLSSIKGHV